MLNPLVIFSISLGGFSPIVILKKCNFLSLIINFSVVAKMIEKVMI